MELDNPLTVLFAVTLGVWSLRTARALKTLRFAPWPRTPEEIPQAGKVSILVPAKNEEKNIRSCIESLLCQDYPDFEIIVINDNSTDKTLEILLALGAEAADGSEGRKHRLRYVNAPPAPAGWTGKNHALACGVPWASGDWFLFTDADTLHEQGALSAALNLIHERGLILLTLLPRCLAHGFWEKLVQPLAMSLMGLWFPIYKANDPRSPIAFGNGQYLLMHRRAYEFAGGHSAVRGKFLEDFALAAKIKESGLPCAVGIGTEIFGTRMYDSPARVWQGWRRIYLHAFKSRALDLAFKSAALVIFSVLPFLWLGFAALSVSLGRDLPLPAVLWGGAAAALAMLSSWKVYELIGAEKKFAWLHPIAALFVAGVLADAARMAVMKSQTRWR